MASTIVISTSIHKDGQIIQPSKYAVGESLSKTSQYLGDNGSFGGGISPDHPGDGSLNISNYTL